MIKDVAREITEKSLRSVQLADAVQEIILSGQGNVFRTQSKYAEHSQDIHKSVAEIRSIAEKTGHLLQYKEAIADNLRELGEFSQENASNHRDVNENVEQIITQVQRVNEHCRKMSDAAGEMGRSVAYFKKYQPRGIVPRGFSVSRHFTDFSHFLHFFMTFSL